ncbi:MAG TPA: hypothetical protein VFU06_01270 [Longimicrobiales bacterium]|nr:hypothetical protein [Longimicrobiales bacterium]
MPDKPPTTDPEQREHDTASSRHQSGLPPEPKQDKPGKPPLRPRDVQKKDEASDK